MHLMPFVLRKNRWIILQLGILLSGGLARPGEAGPATVDRPAPPRHVLRIGEAWLLDPPRPGRFDASALLRLPDGTLLTVNDKELPLCEIQRGTNGTARLRPRPDLFAPAQLAAFAREKRGPYDSEGLALDGAGRIYLCEEGNRWILRLTPGQSRVERLDIDWGPVRRWFSTTDGNASFEGIAVGGNRLYVANERSTGRLIEVDLATLRVTGDFQVAPGGREALDVAYSDLAWFEDRLWVLCRQSRCVLEVDPASRQVVAEYDYQRVEGDPAYVYATLLPFGFMEGLAVDRDSLWLLVDNNGLPRKKNLLDQRPTLFRCPRPRPGRPDAVPPAPGR